MNGFRISVSAVPYADKNKILWREVRYQQQELTIDKFVELIKQGYCFCHCFNTTQTKFKVTEKRDCNFRSAPMVLVDVDNVETPMREFVDRLTKKPTIAYTTPNNHTEKFQWLYRFRLCYLMDEPITTIMDYKRTYNGIMQSIYGDIPTLKMKDNCGRKASQQFGGNALSTCELIKSDYIYSLSDFPFENNDVSLFFSFYQSETEKVNYAKENITITNIDFMEDLNRLNPTDFIEKYQERYPYFDHTELHFENGYALIPENYQEIYRSWYIDTFEKANGDYIKVSVVKKHRDGDGRRNKLFIAGLVMKQIMPSITYEHLICNLVYERTYYYDNSDRVLTNEVLKAIAKNVMQTPLEEIRLQSRNKKKYVVDKSYCAEHGISANSMKNKVRKLLNDEEIGNVYDCSKSVKDNLVLFKEMGIKIGKTKLYDWCKENGINTKGNKTQCNVFMEITMLQPRLFVKLTEVQRNYYNAKDKEEKQLLSCELSNLPEQWKKAI